MNIDKTLNNDFYSYMYNSFPNSALVQLIFLIYISILQTTALGGGGEEGAVGEGVRLWLFIYCYIDIKVTQ